MDHVRQIKVMDLKGTIIAALFFIPTMLYLAYNHYQHNRFSNLIIVECIIFTAAILIIIFIAAYKLRNHNLKLLFNRAQPTQLTEGGENKDP